MSTGATVAIDLALVAFVVLLGVNPRWPLSRFMFRSRGPRTDVVCLTRRQLFAEGARFFYLAVFAFALMWAAVSIGDAMKADLFTSPLAGGAFFIVVILFGMSILAGTYMLVRGLFRSPRYVPA